MESGDIGATPVKADAIPVEAGATPVEVGVSQPKSACTQ